MLRHISVDSDIFCTVIHLPACSKTYIKCKSWNLQVDELKPLSLKVVSNHGVLPKLRFKNTLPTSNDTYSVRALDWFT